MFGCRTDGHWCLDHQQLFCRLYYMVDNMCINLLECEGASLNVICFHWPDRIGKIWLGVGQMAIDVLVTGNWFVDYIICHETCLLTHQNVKGHSTQHNWPDRIGKICLHAVQIAIDVSVTGNWYMNCIICCATCLLICWNVKGHSTQHNFFPLTG